MKSVQLAHGSGGQAMQQLIGDLFMQAFANPWLAEQEDQYLEGRIYLNCGDATATEIDHEVMKKLKEAYEEARRLLTENRKALDRIAGFLIQRETITGKEFMEIFHQVQNETSPASEEG